MGGGHACALLEGGSVKCWGDGLRGELGIGIIGTKMTPTTVPFSGTVTQVTTGNYHTCFLKSDGTVWCFGDNQYGQLGDGTNQDRFTPVQASISNVTQISAGDEYTCALNQSGNVFCWGSGNEGRTGLGNNNHTNTPSQISGLSGISLVKSMNNHSCAKYDNGTLKCWGEGNQEQLGFRNNWQHSSTTPILVIGGLTFSDYSGARNSTCGISNDAIYCWGGDADSYSNYEPHIGYRNELGRSGVRESAYHPKSSLRTGNFKAGDISAGNNHYCAIEKITGKILCWGNTGNGAMKWE